MTGTVERGHQASRDRDRIINISDGVFAIAITLLVLDIHVPDIPENMVVTELSDALLALWPKYLGYFLSFVGISTFWTIHHSIFRPIRAYDRGLLYLNFRFLMFVAFVPFPTSLLGEYATTGFRWPSTPQTRHSRPSWRPLPQQARRRRVTGDS